MINGEFLGSFLSINLNFLIPWRYDYVTLTRRDWVTIIFLTPATVPTMATKMKLPQVSCLRGFFKPYNEHIPFQHDINKNNSSKSIYSLIYNLKTRTNQINEVVIIFLNLVDPFSFGNWTALRRSRKQVLIFAAVYSLWSFYCISLISIWSKLFGKRR